MSLIYNPVNSKSISAIEAEHSAVDVRTQSLSTSTWDFSIFFKNEATDLYENKGSGSEKLVERSHRGKR